MFKKTLLLSYLCNHLEKELYYTFVKDKGVLDARLHVDAL